MSSAMTHHAQMLITIANFSRGWNDNVQLVLSFHAFRIIVVWFVVLLFFVGLYFEKILTADVLKCWSSGFWFTGVSELIKLLLSLIHPVRGFTFASLKSGIVQYAFAWVKGFLHEKYNYTWRQICAATSWYSISLNVIQLYQFRKMCVWTWDTQPGSWEEIFNILWTVKLHIKINHKNVSRWLQQL